MNLKTRIFLLIILIIPNLLDARGFDRGKFILFLAGAQGIGNNSGTIERNLEEYNVPINPFVTNPSVDTGSVVIYEYFLSRDVSANRTNLRSQSGELGFEYGIWRYFGLGLSVSTQTIRSSRTVTVDRQALTLYPLVFQRSSDFTQSLRLGSTLDFFTQTEGNIFLSSTADLSFFFHFNPGSSFDPYLRVGGGAGREQLFGGQVNRLFGSFGMRYHFNDRIFLFGEIEHSNVYIVNFKAPNNGYRNKGNYEETFAKFGAGLSFQIGSSESIEQKEPVALPSSRNVDDSFIPKEKPLEAQNQIRFLASDLFDLPDLRVHLEGRATVDAIARKLNNEYVGYDIVITTTTTPFEPNREGWSDNYELGKDRARMIAKLLREKGVEPSRIIEISKGSTNYKLDSVERVIFEFRLRPKPEKSE
ncbi:MAG: hypothetical protein O9301_14495 [Leptospira sp.]|nr:hypothetical protein [Leptospira sp.]